MLFFRLSKQTSKNVVNSIFTWASQNSWLHTLTHRWNHWVLLENSRTFYDREIILLNIVFLWSSWAQNAHAVHQRGLGKLRQARDVKSAQLYGKWWQKLKNWFLLHFYPIARVWILIHGVEDTQLQKFLLSSLHSFDSIFLFWLRDSLLFRDSFDW